MKSRIAIFSGYASPFRGTRRSSMGAPIFNNPRVSGRRLGGPIFDNPRLSSLGRRGYYVPERNESVTDSRLPYRKGYKVKAKRDTPAMKRAQKRFKVCARKCSKQRGARSKFPTCMRKCIKKKSKR